MAPSAIWTAAEETSLLDFLVDNKAEAGDGGNFNKTTFQRAVTSIAPLLERGAAKTVKSCQNKWASVSFSLYFRFYLRRSSEVFFSSVNSIG